MFNLTYFISSEVSHSILCLLFVFLLWTASSLICSRPVERRGVSRAIYLTLLVMYSYNPCDSMGFLFSLILTLLTITVTLSLFLSIYPPYHSSLLLPSCPRDS